MGNDAASKTARATLEALLDPVLVFDQRGAVTYANGVASALFGPLALLGREIDALFPERLHQVGGVPILRWLWTHAEERRRAVHAPMLGVGDPDPEIVRSLRLTILEEGDEGPMLVAMIGVIAEELPVELEPLPEASLAVDRYHAVFDSVPVGVLHFDREGTVTDCNDLFVEQMGSARALLTGVRLATLPNAEVAAAAAAALAGEVGRFEGEYTSVTGGRSGLYRAAFSPIFRNGRVEGGVGVVEDITERTAIERRLAQGERMASLGRLAAGVAHEINNPLAYVRTSLDIARRDILRLSKDIDDARFGPLIETIDRADEGIERVRVIAGDLRTFSRGDESSWVPVDLARVADTAVKLTRTELHHRATLVREIDAVPPVMGSETRFVQVLVNLLVNAAQALPDGGGTKGCVTLRIGLAEAERIFLEVEDDGPGMDPSVVPHVFEPFWTSKPPGVGTGLGLSICHGIVASAGGEIRVARSTPGEGTTLRIELPTAGAEGQRAARRSARRPPRPTPTRRHRVLVIDDEPQLGVALRVALTERYDVTVSGSGGDALRRLEGGQRFDLVLCDLMMPEMSGMDVYAAVLERVPDQVSRFVFMTGGAFTERSKAFLAQHGVPHLRKPFGLEEVHALLVKRMLG